MSRVSWPTVLAAVLVMVAVQRLLPMLTGMGRRRPATPAASGA